MLKTIQRITVIVIIVSIILLVAYDTVAALLAGSNGTISWVTWTAAHVYPVIPFGVGFLCGHLFWSQTSAVVGKT
jgi:hypothetical protein